MPTKCRGYDFFNISNDDYFIYGPPKKGKKGKTLKNWEKKGFFNK